MPIFKKRSDKKEKREYHDLRGEEAYYRAKKEEEEYWEKAREKLVSALKKEKPEKQTVIIQPQPVYIGKEKGLRFSTIIILGIIIIIASAFFTNCYGIGICQVWMSELKTNAEPFIAQLKYLGVQVITVFKNPQEIETRIRNIGAWSNPSSVNVEKEKKGVIIKDFSSRRPSYREDQSIFVKADIEVKNLDNDAELLFSCEMNDYKGEVITRLIQQDIEGSEVNLFVRKGFDTTIPVMCIFPQGIKIDDEKQIISKEVNLNVLYNYRTKSTLRLYTLDENIQESVKDPFQYYGEKQTLIEAGLWQSGLVKSSQEFGGPIELAIGVEKQPLNIRNYEIVVRLINHFETWNGDLEEIEDLRLRLPINVDINERFCEDFSGRTLKQEIIEEINKNKCTTNDLINPSSEKYEECSLKRNKIDLKLFCEITLNDLPETPMEFLPLEAYLDYKYKTKKTTNVRITKQEIKEEKNLSELTA